MIRRVIADCYAARGRRRGKKKEKKRSQTRLGTDGRFVYVAGVDRPSIASILERRTVWASV